MADVDWRRLEDDLNPLYIYEAKMSLLIQVAQTRQGAERLLEARLLSTLASCDYLDARPEANQAFLGMFFLGLFLILCLQ